MVEVDLFMFTTLYIVCTGFAIIKAYKLGRTCGYDDGVVDGTNGRCRFPPE